MTAAGSDRLQQCILGPLGRDMHTWIKSCSLQEATPPHVLSYYEARESYCWVSMSLVIMRVRTWNGEYPCTGVLWGSGLLLWSFHGLVGGYCWVQMFWVILCGEFLFWSLQIIWWLKVPYFTTRCDVGKPSQTISQCTLQLHHTWEFPTGCGMHRSSSQPTQ